MAARLISECRMVHAPCCCSPMKPSRSVRECAFTGPVSISDTLYYGTQLNEEWRVSTRPITMVSEFRRPYWWNVTEQTGEKAEMNIWEMKRRFDR